MDGFTWNGGTTTCHLGANYDGYSDGSSEIVETCFANYSSATQITSTEDANPVINPGSVDIPDNIFAEDCSGSDDASSVNAPFIWVGNRVVFTTNGTSLVM